MNPKHQLLPRQNKNYRTDAFSASQDMRDKVGHVAIVRRHADNQPCRHDDNVWWGSGQVIFSLVRSGQIDRAGVATSPSQVSCFNRRKIAKPAMPV